MPYRHTNSKGQTYYLHGKEVTLQNGRAAADLLLRPRAQGRRGPGRAPPGREVVENSRTGLPFLKGTAPAPAAAPSAPATRTAPKGTAAGAQRTATTR